MSSRLKAMPELMRCGLHALGTSIRDVVTQLMRDRRGAAAVEFALVTPVLLMMMLTLFELGRGYVQANAIEKGLRNGALYAARSENPLSADDQASAFNLAKTGTLDGSGGFLASAWADGAATLDLTTTTFTVDTETIPVYRMDASVPFDPMFPDMMSWLGLGDITITLNHEQAYVGD
ncbi:MAG: pilus assembly protein [Alphaproteobacteria bacterium]|nr:pilus assembly protein [Alphaproteobacteria bacterium]